jgi:hypothetical protein
MSPLVSPLSVRARPMPSRLDASAVLTVLLVVLSLHG